ncbi:hypothetical protein [Metamycoplasma buccale]|uniref:hypothetical protein n=1 Tax=Metamycoplasma buccale TaxID=55602 RepID=UPI00398EFE0F
MNLSKPPIFTEEKLKELLHYTDQKENPSYDAYKSNCFYKIYSGAKGVSKSFGRMIETVYRMVNENIFCSVWCRNQYNHITNTLKPMLQKVLAYLAEEHNLDYRNWFNITNEAAYWKFDDGGLDRAIYFQNWAKIQAFQGFTLKNPKFRFGELVIDEPLEDVADSNKLPSDLITMYEIQQEKLPLLIANTVLREIAPDKFNINVTFLYNIFTTDHFLIKDYHQKIIPILTNDGEVNNDVLDKLIENNFVQVENSEFSDGLGAIVTMFSKMFIPKKFISDLQLKTLNQLKNQNYRLWLVTVAGFASKFENGKISYFMKQILFDETGQIRKKRINFITKNAFFKLLNKGEIIGVYHGFDPGIHDNASLVTVALNKDGKLYVVNVINDIKNFIPKNTRFINKAINEKVAETVKFWNDLIYEHLPNDWVKNNFMYGKTSILFSDNNATLEALNILFDQKNIDSYALPAVRKPSQKFGILDRQMWQKNIFENELIYLLPNTDILIKYLAKQAIIIGEKSEQRVEEINHEIYDLINAFEMSCSIVFKYQYPLIINAQRRKNGK